MDENGKYKLTQEYIDKTIQLISSRSTDSIENMQKETLEELNDILEKAKKIKVTPIKEKGKNGFMDCIDDDNTKLSNMQESIKIIKENAQDNIIEHTNDEQGLEQE